MMKTLEERLEDELVDVRATRDAYWQETDILRARLREIVAAIEAPINGETEDVSVFGRGEWVYCRAHRKPHLTGWCTVSPRDKIGLGVQSLEDAEEKCKNWKLGTR